MDDLNIKALRALSHCPMSADQLAEVLKISPGQSRELLHKLNPLLTVEASDAGAAFRLNAGMATVGVVDFSEARVLLLLSDLGGRVLARTSLPRAFIITESVLFETLNRLEALLNEQAVAELSALVQAQKHLPFCDVSLRTNQSASRTKPGEIRERQASDHFHDGTV